MGDLKPIGSEKLQGADKIKRIMEIARYNESAPNSLNETSKSEYKLTLSDGHEYQIVKEKAAYIIKRTINESNETEYIAHLKDRKYYNSYSQALRRLNLMAKEMNERYENTNGTSLFNEQKYSLKLPKSQAPIPSDDVENVPAPAPSAAPTDLPTDAGMPSDVPPMPDDALGDDMSGLDMGSEDMGEMPPEDGDEVVTFKTIQKLTGKLGQKLRTLNANEENKMSSNDIKYVINSILSALELENLEDEDRESIVNKIEGNEDESNDFDGEFAPTQDSVPDEAFGDEEPMGGEEMPPQPDQEVFGENIYMESKIGNILLKYFNISEGEKKYNRVINRNRKEKELKQLAETTSNIKNLSENNKQLIKAKEFAVKNPNAKLIGKTNLKSLVFENGNRQFKINIKGEII